MEVLERVEEDKVVVGAELHCTVAAGMGHREQGNIQNGLQL
jgi:hypothetical protein